MKFSKRPVLAAVIGAALLGATALSVPARAAEFDFKTMSAQQKADFGAAVRSYLMEHPEVLVEAINKLQAQQAQQQANSDVAMVKANAKALFDDPGSWVGGNPNGDVTLVEFMDYRCGYCRKAFPEVLKLLKTDGNIRYIVKEFPILSEQSVIGARYALAVRQVAGDEAYHKAHDLLMELNGPINDAALKMLSAKIGVDFAKVEPAMASASVEKIIKDNRDLANRLKINGTPTFVLNDQMLRGYVPYDQLTQLVKEARSN